MKQLTATLVLMAVMSAFITLGAVMAPERQHSELEDIEYMDGERCKQEVEDHGFDVTCWFDTDDGFMFAATKGRRKYVIYYMDYAEDEHFTVYPDKEWYNELIEKDGQ